MKHIKDILADWMEYKAREWEYYAKLDDEELRKKYENFINQ